MFQRFAGLFGAAPSRRGLAVVLAFWLNLALLPCAMALQVPDQGHDCCPPTIELQQSDCCEFDAIVPDNRVQELDKPGDFLLVSNDAVLPLTYFRDSRWQAPSPPDPAYRPPPRHKLFCVYLN